MKKQLLLLFFTLYILQHALFAQTPDDVIKCATVEQDILLRSKYPALGSLDEFENDLQKRIVELNERRKNLRTTAEVITIPIIVHVIHNGEAIGQGANISAAQVQSQLDALNEDFRRKPGTRGFNNNPVGADIEIEFCLAKLDPKGNTMPEPGIDRQRGSKSEWTRPEIESEVKPRTYWDPDKYFNVWVVGEMSEGPTTLLGYAQFPIRSNLTGIPAGSTAASTDGVVVWNRAFGRGNFNLSERNNLGRTLTHEVGHWLGLRHIWGDRNGSCGDDFVADTPPADNPNYGCATGKTSCGSVNMVQNYMDYSDDACLNIFTQGQKTRMRAVMDVSPRRNSLLSSNVCGNTVIGRPIANFRSDRQVVLRGGTVTFNDLSANFPTTWLWTFEGGEPGASTERNPIVVYNTPGKYRVTLTAANAFGSDTTTKEQYIEVSSEGICNSITNFTGTRTLLKAPLDSIIRGYVAGHNNLKQKAKSEFFANNLGYEYIGGAALRFGYVHASKEDATVTILVWNAHGFQGGPGAVLERKEVLLSKIQQDIARGVATEVTFERNVPLFGRGFHVGVELAYTGDTVALITTRNGEANFATSWEQDSTGRWEPYTISQGLNIAHDISASVGMKPSVQVSASALIINPGETVTLNARGATFYSWAARGSGLNATLGQQIIASPLETTTYTVKGTGVDACRDSASITVIVRGAVGVEPEVESQQFQLYPNPNDGQFSVSIANDITGPVIFDMYNTLGNQVFTFRDVKAGQEYKKNFNFSSLPDGMYMLVYRLDKIIIKKKIIISSK